ncbi:MAG: hypothetical protein AB7N91_08395 [Candidatus Tectimicrobiota bacterium]
MESPSLPITSYILLSLLLFQKLSGADLRQRALEGHSELLPWLTPSQIDRSLRLLTQEDFVSSADASDATTGEPVYSITPQGEAAVHHWLMHTPVTADGSADVSLGHIPWGRLMPQHAIRPLLETHRQQCLEALAACESQMRSLPQCLCSSDADDLAFFPSLVLQFRIAELRTNVAWAERVLAQCEPPSSS